MSRPSSHNCPACRAGYLEWDHYCREWVCETCDWTSKDEKEEESWHPR